MKNSKLTFQKLFLLLLTGFFNLFNSQHGVSSGSVSHAMSNGFNSVNERGFLNENTIIVEDFMNYHQHQIKNNPNADITLSVDYNSTVLKNKNTILQIGIATKNITNVSEKNRVNVCLVIDNSGSMDDGKLEKVKKAAKVFVKGLGQNDIISIVKFDGRANIVLPATLVKIVGNIDFFIDGIYPSGSTNINDGLQKGYEEVSKNNTPEFNSRVILLTDGMTNTGITDPEQILKNSKLYNDKGIDISTIGVGNQLDFDLLRKIADYGRGSNYFIGNIEEDIQKTFIDELQSLLYSIGKNPEITITFPENVKIINFYGYQPKFKNKNTVSVDLENLDCGQTQVLVMEIENNSNAQLSKVSAKLNYEKNGKKKSLEISKSINSEIPFTNVEVKKNFQLAKMATDLKNASTEYQKKNLLSSKKIMEELIDYYQSFCDLQDKNLKRIYEIASKYNPKVYAHFYLVY